MKDELILIRYGEIALKSEETRNRFENSLITNIKNAMNSQNITCKIKKERGRIFLYSEKIFECTSILKRIFGIVSFSPSIKIPSEMESISEVSLEISKNFINKENSFALRVSRTGVHTFSSQDVAIKVGEYIVNLTKAKVDLNNPDFEIFIEIRDKTSYIFTEKIPGMGGMPLATQGKVIALITDIKSLLAAWFILRRGCSIHFAIFDEKNIDMINSFADTWFLNKDKLLIDIKKNKLLEDLNIKAKEKKCDAIVTGISLFEKNESELRKLISLKRQIDFPVLHPLIAMDINQIINKCKEIGLKK